MKYNDFFTPYDIYMELYLIGYSNIGESILVIIRDKDNIWFTAVVDAFKYYNINKTLDLIKFIGINNLDLLCLTHTHNDHYRGFLEILEHFGYKKIENLCLPMGHSPQELFSLVDASKYPILKQIFGYINKNINNFGDKFIRANQSTLLYERNFKTPLLDSGYIRVNTFSPLTHVIEQNENKNIISLINSKKIQDIYTNNYSIGINIKFGNRNICLMSDILNKTFDELKYLGCENIDFLKIPHHGSPSSLHCIQFLERNNIYNIKCAGVTSYNQKCDLPDMSVIKQYYNKLSSNIHCTSNIRNRKLQKNRYGYIKYTIPFGENKSIKTETHGNAIQLF